APDRHGDGAGARGPGPGRRRRGPRDLRVRPRRGRGGVTEVAIVGIGMHEFGRTDGVSGLEQGEVATRRALADAGIGWDDVQFAVGGSMAAGSADTMVGQLGLTGLPFTNVVNGCATGGTALATACSTIRSGAFDLGVVVGFDKHERGAF